MNKKFLAGIQILIFLFCSSIVSSYQINHEKKDLSLEILDGGWIEEINGIKVLHLNGSYYDMGYQHGYLLKDEVRESVLIFIDYFEEFYDLSYDECLSIWNKTKNFFPQQLIDEIQGIADGSGLSFEKIAIAQIIRMKYHCSLICASGPSTSDGKLYYARSLDWHSYIKDPETGNILDNHILFVRNPEEGYASMYPGYIGFVAAYGGFNENGIAIAAAGSYSSDETYYGLSERFKMKLVLDHSLDLTDAIEITKHNKTCGISLIISDSKTNESVHIARYFDSMPR